MHIEVTSAPLEHTRNTGSDHAHAVVLAATTLCAADSPSFNTAWITAKPEVLTYQSKAKQGDGLYQVSVSRTKSGIELYMNIITPGFTKSVWGTMTTNMQPRESKSRIIVSGQVAMTTDCSYQRDSLHIATVMSPYDRVVENTLSNSNLVVDFSQAPLLARTLPLKPGAAFEFPSLNPQNNTLVPLTLRVVGEATMQKTECYRVEGSDFEGFWNRHWSTARLARYGSGKKGERRAVSGFFRAGRSFCRRTGRHFLAHHSQPH